MEGLEGGMTYDKAIVRCRNGRTKGYTMFIEVSRGIFVLKIMQRLVSILARGAIANNNSLPMKESANGEAYKDAQKLL
jgi:hypothetical protein